MWLLLSDYAPKRAGGAAISGTRRMKVTMGMRFVRVVRAVRAVRMVRVMKLCGE